MPQGAHFQLFLIFEDDTYYELWTDSHKIKGAGAIGSGGKNKVLSAGRQGSEILFDTYLDEQVR